MMSKSFNYVVPSLTIAFVVTALEPSFAAVSGYGEEIAAPSESAVRIQAPEFVNKPLIKVAFSSSATASVIHPLKQAKSECSGDDVYVISCLAAAYRKAASLAYRPDYRTARNELEKTAKKLEQLVAKHADKKVAVKKGRNGKYRAIKRAAVAKVRRQAIKIIQETETKLLRSAVGGTRKVHYQRIAQAVGSTKVILRS